MLVHALFLLWNFRLVEDRGLSQMKIVNVHYPAVSSNAM